MRGSVMRAKKILREDGLREIYLSEHLTPTASLLFKETRALVRGKKIASSWTMNGKVFYKKMLTPNEKPQWYHALPIYQNDSDKPDGIM